MIINITDEARNKNKSKLNKKFILYNNKPENNKNKSKKNKKNNISCKYYKYFSPKYNLKNYLVMNYDKKKHRKKNIIRNK